MALPLLPALQLTLVWAVILAVGPLLLLTVAGTVTVQLLASVTVTLYAPAANPVAVAVV